MKVLIPMLLFLSFPQIGFTKQLLPPENFTNELKQVISHYDLPGVFEETDKGLEYQYEMMLFTVHNSDRMGTYQPETHQIFGPNREGLHIVINQTPDSYMGPLVLPQTVSKPYWRTFVNEIKLSNGQYLWVSMSYGSSINEDLIKDLYNILLPNKNLKPDS